MPDPVRAPRSDGRCRSPAALGKRCRRRQKRAFRVRTVGKWSVRVATEKSESQPVVCLPEHCRVVGEVRIGNREHSAAKRRLPPAAGERSPASTLRMWMRVVGRRPITAIAIPAIAIPRTPIRVPLPAIRWIGEPSIRRRLTRWSTARASRTATPRSLTIVSRLGIRSCRPGIERSQPKGSSEPYQEPATERPPPSENTHAAAVSNAALRTSADRRRHHATARIAANAATPMYAAFCWSTIPCEWMPGTLHARTPR